MSNVKSFGAIGDGRTDDTQAIRHALEQGDGLLEFPRGTYRLAEPIVIELSRTGRFSLSGQGGIAKLRMDGPGPAFHVRGTHATTADPGGFRPEEWERERMPLFQQIEIEGGHPEADGILIEGVMQSTLTAVLIREVRHAVRLTGRARNVLISHCHFYHNRGAGVFLDRVNLHQTIIIGSHISYCRLGGVRIEESEIRNLQITGNDIEYNNQKSHPDLPDEATAEIYIDVGKGGSVREGTIVGNTLQATYSDQGANIRMIGGSPESQHKAGMWSISGNLIGSQRNNIHLTSVRGVTIEGNYIYSGHHRNILVEHSRNVVIGPNCFGHNPDYEKSELATGIRLQDCVSCNLSGLIIEDAEAGRHTLPGVEPLTREGLLELVRCRRVNLTGLQILDPTPVGIYLEDCEGLLMSGSTVHDDRTPPAMTHAVLWKGGGAASMITACRLSQGTVNDLDIPEAVRVTGNLRA